MSYLQNVLNQVETKYSYQPEFLQAVREVFESLEKVITQNEKLYEDNAILERITEPDRQIQFRVPWVDDNGKIRVNTGYRVQFNNSIERRSQITSIRKPFGYQIPWI